MTFLQSPIYCCMLGAIAIRLLEIVETSELDVPQKANYASIKFYVSTLTSIVIAVIVGYIYFDQHTSHNRIVYFHTGASAPLIIRTLSSKLPAVIDARLKDHESN